jgi:cytochrome c oxidase subunit 2
MGRGAAPVLVGVLVAAAVFAGAMAAGGDDAPAPRKPDPAPAQRADAASPDGREVFARMGCGSCHRLAAAGSAGRMGPRLDEVLGGHTRASLRSKIVDPQGSSAYSGMPQDFGERMTAAELDALVEFLLST